MRRDITPDDGETYEDFMDRCSDEIDDEDVCQILWDERAAGGDVIRKVHLQDKVDGLEFVMSDETVDLMDEVIMSDGWDLANFKKNPVALFGHRGDFPIGTWSNVRVEGKQLRGKLELAQEGTSERINELIRLVRQGILRAVSVGFRPSKKEPMTDKSDPYFGPFRFLNQRLIECSLVSVPANPNALSVAKSLNVSPAVIDLVFAGHGRTNGLERRGLSGGQAETRNSKGKATMSLAQRIVGQQKHLLGLKEALSAHLETQDDNNVSDEQYQKTHDLNAQIALAERNLDVLIESEKHIGKASEAGGREMVVASATLPAAPGRAKAEPPRPFSLPRKAADPIEIMIRAGVIQLMAHRERKPFEETRQWISREYPGRGYDDEATRTWLDWNMRAASAVAQTTVAGWAAELVQTVFAAFMDSLYPKSIYPRLSGLGLSLTFGRNGKIVIPTRSNTPTIAGSFVGEGLPIPVRQGAFTSQTLTPKKMAVITTWTREIDEHSVPAIEGLLRDAVRTDTAIALDSVLIDNNPATAVRPAGILNGTAALTATAGGGLAALVGDIKQLSGALLTGTKGNVRAPVWLMNPQQVNSAGLASAANTGVFPFREEIGRGQIGGWPIIDSGTVPTGTVIAIDAADFVGVGGDAPRFELSDQATLHMEDTTPADIGTPGTPPVVAAPVKSMWQTDSIALRLILPINWLVRRAGVVAWVQNVTW